MMGEALLAEEQTFADLVSTYEMADGIAAAEDTVAVGGMTSVLYRAQQAAREQRDQIKSGTEAVNGAAAAFQSAV